MGTIPGECCGYMQLQNSTFHRVKPTIVNNGEDMVIWGKIMGKMMG